MDFELDEEQIQLRESVRDLLASECPPSLIRTVVDDSDVRPEVDLWKTYVDLDWPGLAIDPAHGGVGASEVELLLVGEELGRVADPTPLLATTTQYVPLVAACAPGELRAELLAAACAGTTGAAAFTAESVRAHRSTVGWTLTGSARFVMDGARADRLVVVASTPEGPGAFFLDTDSSVTAQPTRSFDGTLHLAHLEFDQVEVRADRAATGPAVADGVVRARQVATSALAASTVGACRHILDLALAHIEHRHQFGVPIGSFQAVKHMAVDMYVAVERAGALYQFAALAIAEDDSRRHVAAAMAKAAAGDCQRVVAQHGIQLFGGLGYTWENDIHLYLRRAKAGELLFGSSAEHRGVVARWGLDRAPAQEVAR